MVGANLKAETMKLMDKRSALETEMNVIIERLCQPGGPGLSGNLVDSEGFPRSDIDIPVVRAERHRLAELRNDHKEITEKIDENIQVLHSSRLATKDSGNDGVSNHQNSVSGNAVPSATSHNVVLRDSSSSMDVDMMASIPFAVVDEIADASPTAEDGLQLGDQLVKFGAVEYQVGENLLQKLASEAQANQGHAVPVIVMRQGAPINLSLTPRVWPGRGLLGYVCLPLSSFVAVSGSYNCLWENKEGGWLDLLPVSRLCFDRHFSIKKLFLQSSRIRYWSSKLCYALKICLTFKDVYRTA
uniref:Nas2 N-terminal domain-containing protein n=1 Tax=Salix viminalis TaxID=40686 RepID=A0A6N2MQS9_SALVM